MKKIYQSSVTALAMLAAATVAFPAFAQVGVNLGANASGSVTVGTGGAAIQARLGAALVVKIKKGQEQADKEIDRRIAALNTWASRVSAAAKLSADEKSSLTASIQTQITAMTTLKAQVDADAAANSTSSLKADIKSITGSYRIFALILPQTAIAAAADRAETIVSTMNDLGTKLQANITAAQTAGNNTTAAAASLTDFNAKVTAANVNAQAAISETAQLTPDQGDQTKFQANLAALKAARTKIQAAQQDFVAARKDAEDIVKALVSFKIDVNATTSASASTSAAQ